MIYGSTIVVDSKWLWTPLVLHDEVERADYKGCDHTTHYFVDGVSPF